MAPPSSLKNDLLKVLDRIERLKPKWIIDGHLGYVPDLYPDLEKGFLNYKSPEGYEIKLTTEAHESPYHKDKFFSASISVYRQNISIYHGYFQGPKSAQWREMLKNTPDGRWTEATCCFFLREYIMNIVAPVVSMRNKREKLGEQTIRDDFWSK